MVKGISKATKTSLEKRNSVTQNPNSNISREIPSVDLLPMPFLTKAQESPLLSPTTISTKYVYYFAHDMTKLNQPARQ